ncbi:MAG: phosphoglycerate dehydrogenase [Ignavibacteria bacterium]|jgi:D-3-phosphoglycerate dehydrogenase|nr:phosphoglycerate dehydrogenase [Ignavibacteria bacterium]MDH7526751.1 phosphoglycerate dehydrogenase [Ignavibacteria bacterium]
MSKKILITDPIESSCIEILQSAGFEVNHKPGLKEDEIISIINDYNVLVLRSETKVTKKIIDSSSNLELLARAGAGVDNIDVNAATHRGIIVMNTPGGNTLSTAEHTMALLLSMCRNIPTANYELKQGLWDRKKYLGTELFGKKIGVIGLGKIGKEVAIRCKAFGMEVLGYDPVLTQDAAQKIGVRLVSIDEIFEQSDIITVHVPLSNETKNLIDKKAISKCKDGVKIINCARGGIVNEEALLEGLKSGKVSAAALDVFEKEPPQFPNELIEHPKVVVTPHIGASTKEAQEKVAVQIANQIIDFYKNGNLIGAVNAYALEKNLTDEIRPFIELAKTLGKFFSQISQENINNIELKFHGSLLQKFRETLTSAFLIGYLSKKITGTINFVNAQLLAEETGIKIIESNELEHETYKNLFTASSYATAEIITLSGTIFGKNDIRIVRVNDYSMDIHPTKYMLLYENIDKPGMLAAVGSILAKNQINIAGLSLGRKEIGGKALTLMNLDSKLATQIIDDIKLIDGIGKVLVIEI